MLKWLLRALWVLFLGVAAAVGLYFLPPVHERLAWRVENLAAMVRYQFNPPEKAVFVPQQSVDQIVSATLQVALASPTPRPSLTPSLPAPASGTSEPLPAATPSTVPTAVPPAVILTGFVHEYQGWNNCGPATLAMALSHWGWKGTQTDTAAFLKPNPRDKNVMPYEMQDYIAEKTTLKSALRVGGDTGLLKRLVAAGFPVIVEKGFEPDPKEGWMGHYEVIMGYDDAHARFSAEDAYTQLNDQTPLTLPYSEMEVNWRAFNYIYLVIYPPERESQLMAVLGPQADEQVNFQAAAQKASNEIPALAGRDLFFAWYNRGTDLVSLQDYAGAAAAYDQAFALYPAIPEKKRPWRMLWYQTGPYFAYFYTGRYTDVINLASTAIGTTSEPAIEESFVWRARAEAAAGNTSAAVDDLRTSLRWHPAFAPALAELANLGASPN